MKNIRRGSGTALYVLLAAALLLCASCTSGGGDRRTQATQNNSATFVPSTATASPVETPEVVNRAGAAPAAAASPRNQLARAEGPVTRGKGEAGVVAQNQPAGPSASGASRPQAAMGGPTAATGGPAAGQMARGGPADAGAGPAASGKTADTRRVTGEEAKQAPPPAILDAYKSTPAAGIEKIKDLDKSSPIKVDLYNDKANLGSTRWNRMKVDYTRNGRWDEKWTDTDGDGVFDRRQISTKDDESYDREMVFRDGRWVDK